MTREYWQWPESRWASSEIDWRKRSTITAGIDVGAVSSQAVVMCDNDLYCYANIRTGPDSGINAVRAMEMALEGTGMKMDDIRYTVATGYGRKNVPVAQQAINEVTCHVQGARFIYGPTVKTVIDMGGQGVKVMKCTEAGRIVEFYFNDKCATGMGRGVELLAKLMHIPLAEVGELSLSVEKDPEPVSTTCYVFANTEALGMFRDGEKENVVLAAYMFAVAYRIFIQAGRVAVAPDIALTGGLAKNSGVSKRLERELGMTIPSPSYDTQLAGAIGAALLAKEQLENPRKALASVK